MHPFHKKPKDLSIFLKKHAIRVDETRLGFVMKNRKVSGLYRILQEAGCPVDSKLAESLEFSLARR